MLCDRLAVPPADPFEPELVAVPSRGIERWLTQRIASGMAERGQGDGICANIEFPSPARLVRRTVTKIPEVEASMRAWEGEGLVANLIEVIDANLDQPWLEILATYLDSARGSNRLHAATKLARLFDRYGRHRPEMILSWSEGADVGPDLAPLPPEHAWQPPLWRALRETVATPSLPELLPAALTPLRTGEVELDLPGRIAVYGLTSTDRTHLQVLNALAAQRQVDLYVLHPSPALWAEVARMETEAIRWRRDEDPTADAARHPLLQSWGRSSRELQSILASEGIRPPASDHPPGGGVALLERLQADIRHNREPHPDPALAAVVQAGEDRSIRFHACQGSRRQAEVVRDAILHILADNPELEPRDVVVMTPDLATYAPLLEAAFPRNSDAIPDLRLRIADRSPAATNPLVVFTSTLLGVLGSRLEANTVRDLVKLPVVQDRFGIDADSAGEIVSVIDDIAVSWGIDAEDRNRWGVGSVSSRTWRRGLDRALAGVFYPDDPVLTVAGVAPLDGVEGQEATPVGILAAILDRITAIRRVFSDRLPRSQWGTEIARAVRMLAAPEWGEEWQIDQLERLLAETFPEPEEGEPDPAIALVEAAGAISAWAQDRPSPLHFRSGDITVCTLVPMRSVPYRVVCLLGMDESRFPRQETSDGDDLLNDDPRVGDHDVASADRQLLLDALMAAGSHLVVTYSGRDPISNLEVPPAVPIAELTGVVETMLGKEAAATLFVRHPLQSFSAKNFLPGALGVPGPWSYDGYQLAGAGAVPGGKSEQRSAGYAWPLPFEPEPVRLDTLIAFFRDPPKRFALQRLGLTVPEPEEIPDDTLPVGLEALARWRVTDRLLSGLLAGHPPDGLLARELESDELPPGRVGRAALDDAFDTARSLWEATLATGYDPRSQTPFAGVADLGTATVEGTVTANATQGHVALVTAGRIRGHHRLRLHIQQMFLTVVRPDVAWSGLLVGRGDQGPRPRAVTLLPPGRDERDRPAIAAHRLADLVAIYEEGMRRPLPLPCETSYAWQRNLGKGAYVARSKASDAFGGDFGESKNPTFRLVLPEHTDLDTLVGDDEFAELCQRVWLPILRFCSERSL